MDVTLCCVNKMGTEAVQLLLFWVTIFVIFASSVINLNVLYRGCGIDCGYYSFDHDCQSNGHVIGIFSKASQIHPVIDSVCHTHHSVGDSSHHIVEQGKTWPCFSYFSSYYLVLDFLHQSFKIQQFEHLC